MYRKKSVQFTKRYNDQFERRTSLNSKDSLGELEVAWTADVVSRYGANYHYFVPKNLFGKPLKEFLEKCHFQASHQGDRVSSTWSYIPES